MVFNAPTIQRYNQPKPMNIEAIHAHCLTKKGSSDDFPFDETTLVVRCMGKIFALISLESVPLSISLKCNPQRAIELRETYPDIIVPGYHLNKQHWNTISVEMLPSALVFDLIDHSYDLIAASLKKAEREALATM